MTVNTQNIVSGPYAGNGVTTSFAYDFRVENKNQLLVYELVLDTGVETLLTVDTDYTVGGIGVDTGGTVTRVAGALPAGSTWYIRSNYDSTQLTDFESQGNFLPAVHESAFDHLTFLVQQLEDQITRSFRLSETKAVDGEFTLNSDASGRAAKVLAFDGKGDLVLLDQATVSLVSAIFAQTFPLSAGQTVVTTAAKGDLSSFYVVGPLVDSSRLIGGIDYTFDTSSNQVTLTESYPAGTQLVMVYNDAGASATGSSVGFAQVFDTVALMKAASPATGVTVHTRGYYAAGDGGHGTYLVGAPASVDGYIDHTLANGNIATLLYDGGLNILVCGATGDGTTNDAPAINAAVAKAPVSVYFPSKTYNIGAAIVIGQNDLGVHFYGDAPGSLNGTRGTALFQLGYDGAMFTVNGSGSATHLGLIIERMKFEGDADNGRLVGTWLEGDQKARTLTFSEVYVSNFYDYGLNAIDCARVQLLHSQIFNCGINIYGQLLGDSRVVGGQSGSGAGGGSAWVGDNISILGSSGNTHFTNHRPNFSAGVGVRIGGNATRITFSGGLCDQNLGGGFILEGNCTAIKIMGMDIFDNGTTSVNQPGIKITSGQAAAGFVEAGGISIVGNSIFDREKGAAGEKQDVGIEFDTGGGVAETSIVGNGLIGCTTPIKTATNVVLKPTVHIGHNVGWVDELQGTTATVDIASTGVKTITVDVSALSQDLHSGSVVALTLTSASHLDFVATVTSANATTGTTFDVKVNVTTASATGGATAKVAWHVFNGVP